MNIMRLCDMLEQVEANASMIAEEDKEPLNHLNRMLNGSETMVLGQTEYDLVQKVHTYIFYPDKAKT